MLDKGEQIAIWGTGMYAKKVYMLQSKNYEVVCFYDNDKTKWNQEIYGIPIKKWDHRRDIKIIIASSWWEEIIEQLLDEDLHVLENVIPYHLVSCQCIHYNDLRKISKWCYDIEFPIKQLKGNRKVAVIYGNCQTLLLREILLLNRSFADQYFFIAIPAVCDYNAGEEARELWNTLLAHDEFWSQIDLFLCQKVNESNKFCRDLATDNIIGKLASDCQIVMLINIYFNGYFIQRVENTNNVMKEVHQSGLFPSADIFVDELLKRGFLNDDILKQIQDRAFISPPIIERAVSQSLLELQDREKEVAVGISDYIEQRYKEKQLFYSPNHPINAVLIEYARRIIRFMGLTDQEISEDLVYLKAGCLKGQDIPIYPSVIETLGMKHYDCLYYINRYLEPEILVGFDEYIRKYILYCF